MSFNISWTDTLATIERHNSEYAMTVLPVIVILDIMLLVGLVGNCLVCYIYSTKYKRSTTRWFILCLALLDTFCCLVAIPFETYLMVFNYSSRRTFCSVFITIVHFTSLFSGLVLTAIAIDRSRRICCPLRRQITPPRAKIVIGVCCGFAVVASIPAAVLFGGSSVQLSVNMTGSVCGVSDKLEQTLLPKFYSICLSCIFLLCSVIITNRYVLIWRQLARQKKYKQALTRHSIRSPNINTTDSRGIARTLASISNSNISRLNQYDDTRTKSDEMSSETADDLTNDVSGYQLEDAPNFSTTGQASGSERSRDERQRSPGREKKRKSRKTLIFFHITVIFALSYLPYLGIRAATVIKPNFYDELNDASLALYNVFVRSYLFNCAANPFIYSFFSIKFRREVKSLFRRRTLFCD